MDTKINRTNIESYLVDYMLAMIGKTRLDTLDTEDWYDIFTWSVLQEEEFKVYALKLIRKTFKCNKKRGQDALEFFLLNFGLKINKL